MPFNRPTITTIYSRIVADMESRLTQRKGKTVKIGRFSVLGVLAIVFATAIHLCYGILTWLADQLFVDTAELDYLDRAGLVRGIPRKAASFSVGEISITGSDATVIPQGTEWQNSEGTVYITDDEVVISGGSILANVTAEIAGSSGNFPAIALDIISPLSNVDSEAVITIPMNGGEDDELDSDYRDRVIQRVQNPPSGGKDSDYVGWALEIQGVGEAWTFAAEKYQGAGTVGIVVATEDGEIVSPTAHSEAQTFIDSQKPLGIVTTVEDIDPASIDMDIKLLPNNTQTQGNVTENLSTLFTDSSIVIPGGTILLSRIRSAISSSGVEDYIITDIRVNTSSIGVANIVLSGFEYPAFNTPTYSDLP